MTILANPKTHMAMVYDQPGKVSIKRVSIETPEPGAGQVLVRLLVYVVMMCLLCLPY